MKHKHTHYIYASFALLLFVALGYMVKFYPEALTGFDSNIQTWVRGDLPAGLTRFFKTITILGNTPVQAIIAIVAVIWLYLRQYKAEAIFVGASGLLASILIVSLKYIYQRQRPSITHLVHASGYSFPSGHSLLYYRCSDIYEQTSKKFEMMTLVIKKGALSWILESQVSRAFI